MALDALLPDVLRSLLSELIDGPPPDWAFILNPGDPGFMRSLAKVSAEQASLRPNGRSSVAAHTQHLRYGFELLNRWMRGENPFADASYARSWGTQAVTEEEWAALREALAHEAHAWRAALEAKRDWDQTTLSGAISSIAHLAYHIGAVRQLLPETAGPAASD